MVEVSPDNLWLFSDLVEEATRYWRAKVAALSDNAIRVCGVANG